MKLSPRLVRFDLDAVERPLARYLINPRVTVRKLTLYSRATSRLVARLRGLLRHDAYRCSTSQQEKLVFCNFACEIK
jgi:hypothetical protein